MCVDFLNRRKFLTGVSSLSILLGSPASAWLHGSARPTGKSLIGGFDTNGNSLAFINFMKLANNQQATGGFAYPGVLDASGFPNNSGASLATAITMSMFPPTIVGTNNWVIKWTGDGAFQINPGAAVNVVSSSGCVVSGNLSFGMTVTSNGTSSSPRVVFNFGAGTPGNLPVSFPSGKPYTNMAGLVFCRADQESLNDAGQIFNPDFIALLTALNPRIIRLMDWSGINNSLTSQFAYRAPVAACSFRVSRWQPEAWVGTVGNSGNAYSCSAPSTWPGLVEGATIQGQFTNSNSGTTLAVTGAANNGSNGIRLALADTSTLTTGQNIAFNGSGGVASSGVWPITVIDATHIDLVGPPFQSSLTGTISTTTLNVGGGGPKLISGSGSTATISAGDLATLVFDSVRDAWVYTPRGIGDSGTNGAIPIETQVELCRALNKHLWVNIPFEYTDASVAALATYLRDNLPTNLNAYFELSNETWNNQFTQFSKSYVRGAIFGFPTINAEQGYGYYALRARQIMGSITSIYAAKGQTNYRRVLAFQAFGPSTNIKTYMFNGTDLVAGNAKYNAFTGSTSYSAFPNRPIDFADVISYATYYSGAVLSQGTYAATGTYTGMTGAADDYASGDPTRMASALSWVDTDLRSGTSTIPGFTYQTIGNINTSIYPAWETIAASYDAQRAGGGLGALTVDCYEGGNESLAPTTAQCTTIGISTSYGGSGGSVNTLLTAYKNSALFTQLVIDQYTQMMAQPHSATPAWFALQGASPWSMLPGNTYTGPSSLGASFGGTPFKSWDGTVAYNH